MIPNLRDVPASLRRSKAFGLLLSSKHDFFMTGSHFLGVGDPQSDYDFFALMDKGVEKALLDGGFEYRDGMRKTRRYVSGRVDVFFLERRQYILYHKAHDMVATIPWIRKVGRDARVTIYNVVYDDLERSGYGLLGKVCKI